MNNLLGKQINQYRIEALLGEGGMGAVYRALDVSLERPVALKIMHSQYADQPEFQQRFAQEARAIARLNHPSIVIIYQFNTEGGLLYIAMEYVPGSTLDTYLRQAQQENQRIDLHEILILIAQVADALDYAHRQGIIHRDTKPSNILVRPLEKPDRAGDPPLRAVVTDFGLAKLVTGGVATQTGTFMGSLPYMSPEQALGQELDSRSDIYSLGVVLYQLTTGQLPHDIRTPTDAVLKHMKEVPPPPHQVCPELPPAVETIILKALAKDPPSRYQTAGEMATALRNTASSLTQEQATLYAPPGSFISLATRIQENSVEPRGASIFKEFSPPSDLSQDSIQVLFHGKMTLSMPIKPSLTIGREAGNDIHLDDTQVSRQHARIEFDGINVTIIDLNSANGSFLGDAKLLPGIPEPWTPDKIVRIGSYWLRLVKASRQAGLATPAPASDRDFRPATVASYGPVQVSAGKAQPTVAIRLETSQFFVDPGESVAVKLTVINQGVQVDHYRAAIQGLPSEWVPSIPPPIQALPGDAKEMILTIRPPRSPSSRAGQHPFKVCVTSVSNANQTSEASATLVISPYSQFSSEVYPIRFHSGRSSRLTVNNQGNHPETYKLKWRDPGDELAFTPERVQLQVPEGRSAAAEFRAASRRPHWLGKEQLYTFTAEVNSPEGASETHNGEFVSQARISLLGLFGLFGMLFVCLALAAGGAALIIPPFFRATPTIPPTTAVSGLVIVSPDPTSGPPSTLIPTKPPTVSPVPTPTPTIFIPDFAGKWLTNFSLVELTQTGADVHGHYTWYGANFPLALDGKVEGNSLVGFFGGKESQTFKFTMNPDGQSFDGVWSTEQFPDRQWCGVRNGPLPAGCGFSGHWNSKSDKDAPAQPTADLVQTADQIDGSFFNGETTGTVIGKLGALGEGSQYKASGTYTVDNFTGNFAWELVDFNPFQFRGFWSPREGEVYSWCGWRENSSSPAKCLKQVK